MEKVLIELPKQYSLHDTLYPSFTYPFFEYNNKIVKVVGSFSGTVFYFKKSLIEIQFRDSIPSRFIKEWLGLWFDPSEFVGVLSSTDRRIAETIVKTYRNIRLSVSTCDRDYIFVSVFLSQNTDFHFNTVRWIRKLVSVYGPEFLKANPRFSIAGDSYQLKRLEKVFSTYKRIETCSDLGFLRMNLLSIKGVGPKTADAFILFSSKNSESTPCDVHLKRFIGRLGLVDFKKLPSKNYCSKYYCWFDSECPVKEECLRYLFMNKFRKLSGWIQTIAYLHDKKFCSKSRCEECSFRKLCKFI